MSVIKKYPIRKNRLARGFSEGFSVLEDGCLYTVGSGRHIMFLTKIDSGERDCEWGRLRFDAELKGNAVPVVYAFASNDTEFVNNGEVMTFDGFLQGGDIAAGRKLKLFSNVNATRFTGKTDMLLYGQTGRYLWICIELAGGGAKLSGFTVYAPRDNFYKTFPEIYRNNGDFFHRYLSIFSTLYYDLQDTIDHLHRFIDLDTAPKELLPVYAGWLGLELDGNFLDETHLRKLLKATFGLVSMKGTRKALEELLRVFINEPFYIVEQQAAAEAMTGRDRAVCERLYGASPFDYTVLVCRPAQERLHAQLTFLIKQFVSQRCRVKLVFLEQGSVADSYCYLDINGEIREPEAGWLDASSSLGGTAYLQ